MDENKKKSSRSFELEKGGKRSFDLHKTSARKFDLSKDTDKDSLEELKNELLADGKIDAEEVNRLREVLYADGKIDQEEADFLFELNDAVTSKQNDSSWKAFFVEAITDFLLNDEQSPGVIDEEEGKWLEEKINNDGKLDTVERALVASLRRKSKSMPQSLNVILSQVASRFKLEKDEVPAVEAATAAKALAETKAEANKSAIKKENNETDLAQLKKKVLADGKIDKEELELLRKTLYADGKIDEEEANFLFQLNDAVSGKKNAPAWNQFFVQAISDYLLNDEKSPGVIDEEEGKWLIEKIGVDGQVDGVEKQLLTTLKKNAKSMPSSVISLIDGDKNQSTQPYPVPPTPPADDGGGESNGKWKKYAALAGLVILGGVGYYLSQQGDDTEAQAVAEVVEGQGSRTKVTDGNTANQDVQEQKGDTNVDAATEASVDDPAVGVSSPVGDAPAIGGSSPAVDAPSNSDSPAPEQKKEDATSSVTNPKADAPAKATPSKPVSQPKEYISSTSTVSSVSGTIEEEAIEVIHGKYGNGGVRKRNLGVRYAEIQSKVNEMYRNGQVN